MRKCNGNVVVGLVAALAVAVLPAVSTAQSCGDINDDGNVNQTDAQLLSFLAAGGSPAISVCGTGTLSDCADIVGDGSVSFPAILDDAAALTLQVAGLATIFDACEGAGPTIACPGGTVTIAGQTISSSETWPASCLVKLADAVFFETPDGGPTTVLTIEPGTTVQGIKPAGSETPGLFILPGAKINAQGTPSSPIIFTSDQAPGARNIGDWGGVNINGRSTVNGPDCQFTAEGLPVPFGGCVTNDSSGIARFVRVEFAGIDFTEGNELNLWTMNGLGSQTEFNFIQAHAGNDDCLEWFGGTSSHTNVISSACGDDGFDFQLGFTGSVQFGLQIQSKATLDAGRDGRGIEGDNSEFDNDATPRSDPRMCNLTMLGANGQAGANDGSDSGVLLRRGTHGQFANMIVQCYGDAGLEIRDIATSRDACVDSNGDHLPESLTGDLLVRNSLFFDNGSGGTEHAKSGGRLVAPCTAADPGEDPDCNCNSEDYYDLLSAGFEVQNPIGSNAISSGLSCTDNYPDLDNSFCSGAGIPLSCCTGAGAGTCRALPDVMPDAFGFPSALNCASVDAAFEATGYVGAFDPSAGCTLTGAGASCDWMSKPWVEFAIN